MQRIAIFKVGTHTATNGATLHATADFLRDVVASYNPTLHESPAVIGHPKDNAPAYGWAQSLSFDDGILYANLDQVEPQFKQMLKQGLFKKRSASFYPAGHPNNPVKDKPYLRHIGFLGAQPPAVKGLPDFSDATQNCPTYEFTEFTPQTEEENAMSDTKTQPANTPEVKPTTKTDTADFAEAHAKLDAKAKSLAQLEADIAAREAAFAKQQQDIKTLAFSEFADGLIKTGQLVPAEKDAVVSVMMDLDASENTFDFAENGTVTKKSSVDVFKGVLARLPTTVDFSEHSATDPNTSATPQHGFDANSDAEDDKKIQEFAEKEGITYSEAAARFEE